MTTLTAPLTLPHLADFRAGKPGVYPLIPATAYHAHEALSNSRITDMMRSPAHCRWAMDNPDDDTPATIFGSALHAMVLQPEIFDAEFVVAGQCVAKKGDGARCGNAGKYLIAGEWRCGVHKPKFAKAIEQVRDELEAKGYSLWGESPVSDSVYMRNDDGLIVRVSDHTANQRTAYWMERNGVGEIRVDRPPYGHVDPRTIISGEDFDKCRRARDAAMDHPEARSFLTLPGGNEVSGLAVHEATGQLIKVRFDRLLDEDARAGRMIGDVKTTDDASDDEFEHKIGKYGYYRQAAIYVHVAAMLGIPVEAFGIIAVEKTPPFGVNVFVIEDDLLELGWEEVQPYITSYRQCVETGKWPNYQRGVRYLGVKPWMRKRIEQRIEDAA